MKYIGIIGTRRRDSQKDYKIVRKAFLNICKREDKIVSGGCSKGGDRFAEILVDHFLTPIIIYKPKWHLGRHAGLMRNTDIAKKSDILIACIAKDRKGGTEDTIKKFIAINDRKNLILV